MHVTLYIKIDKNIKLHENVGSQVLTAVVMKSSSFWSITPCSPLKSNDVSEEHAASVFRIEE
jgi:hypothetical protein